METAKMQVIGLCRFSYPALGGFQIEHESPEKRAAFLDDPLSMEERFATFQGRTLPGEDMFIRGHNACNDSRQKEGVRPVPLPLLDHASEGGFRRTYNIDADHIRALYR